MTDKNAIWKWLILLLAVTGSIILVTPKEKIKYGIDLAGGTSFTIELDQDRVVEQIRAESPDFTSADIEREMKRRMDGAQARALEVIRNRVDALGGKEPIIYPYKDNRIIVQLPEASEQEVEEAEKLLRSAAFLEFRIVFEDSAERADKMLSSGMAPPGYEIVDSSAGTRYKRAADYKEMLKKPGAYARISRFNIPSPTFELLMEEETVDGQKLYMPHFIERRARVTGANLSDASVDFAALGDPVVNLRFDSKGAKLFKKVTEDLAPGGSLNPGFDTYRQLAIVLDGMLRSAPRINEAITGGRAQIEGSFTVEEAHELAVVLKAGSLPMPVKIVEKRQVSASLGKDSVKSGINAVMYGGIVVVLFILVYYRACGLIANVALVLNVVLMPLGMVLTAGFLSIFASDAAGGGKVTLPVLTLPGIAGLGLTIGMAVDANVLIFERIREETRAGKSFWNAISAGYDRAFVTIMDSNLTTLLTGVILFVFGSGPIRGFAVTLCGGIIVSMFTALVLTKLLFGIAGNHLKLKSLKMLTICKDTAIDFVGKRKPAVIFSLIVLTVTWGLMVVRGIDAPGKIFGVDFTGGDSLVFGYETEVDIAEIRSSLGERGIDSAMIQYQKALDGGSGPRLQVIVGEDLVNERRPADIVKTYLVDEHAGAGFQLLQEDRVEGQVGKELTMRAISALVISLIGIIIYVAWRFELGFAIGAVVALLHDAMFMVGIYSLFGRQLSLPIVAALLTVIGYSINDTIVIFDRIREDLRLMRNKTFKEICNLSINQTLSRTILTSLTTLITVVMLLIFGGGSINDFALALCIGIVVGTYSTVFIATPVVLAWYKDKRPGFGEDTAQ